jgi:hypothetical protein
MDKIIEKYLEIDYPSELGDNDPEYLGSIDDIYEKAFSTGNKVGFNQGYICAVSNIIKMFGIGEDTIATDVLKANFVLEDANEYDLEVLEPIISQINNQPK